MEVVQFLRYEGSVTVSRLADGLMSYDVKCGRTASTAGRISLSFKCPEAKYEDTWSPNADCKDFTIQ